MEFLTFLFALPALFSIFPATSSDHPAGFASADSLLSGRALSVPNCINPSEANCTACSSGFYVNNGICSECANNCVSCTATECLTCSANFMPAGFSCRICQPGGLQAVILGPSDASPGCGALSYSAALSFLNTSQPVSYTWQARQLNEGGVELWQNTSTAASFSLQGFEPVNSTIQVNLTVESCGLQDSATVYTKISTAPGVSVGHNFGSVVWVNREKGIDLEGFVESYCNNTGGAEFRWTGAVNATGKVLHIGENEISAGTHIEVLSVQVGSVVGRFEFSIKTLPRDIVVVLSRSSGLQPASQNFSLSTANSYDPDSASVLSFQWQCKKNSTSSCLDSQGNVITFPSSSSLLFSTQMIANNSDPTFLVTVSNNGKTSTGSININFRSTNTSIFLPQSWERVNPSVDLYINAAIYGNNSVVLWSGDQISVSFPYLPVLFVAKNSFTQSVYSFELISGGLTIASLNVYVNLPPSCQGQVTVSPASASFGSYFNVLSPSCYDTEDFPIVYSLNDITPYYPLLNASVILPIGSPYNFQVSVCDSLFSCSEITAAATVTPASLSAATISSLYSTATTDRGKVPLTVIAFGLSISLTTDLITAMISDLTLYANTYSNPTTPILAALAALTSTAQTTINIISFSQQILSVVNSLQLTQSDDELATTYYLQILSNLARVKSGSVMVGSENEYLNFLNNSLFYLVPGQSLNYSTPDFSFMKLANVPSSLSKSITIDSSRHLTLPNSLPFSPSQLINCYIFLYKNKGNYSDIIDLTFTVSGTIVNSSLNYSAEVIFPLSKLTQPISIQLVYNTPVPNDWACAYFSNASWYSGGCSIVSNTSNLITFATNHTSLFSMFDISEVKLPPPIYIDNSTPCGSNYNGIWILVVLVFLYIIVFPLLWFFDRIDLKEHKEYDPVKKEVVSQEDSGRSMSMSEEAHNHPNISSDYAIQYKNKQKSQSKNNCLLFLEGHLLFGLPIFRTEFNRKLRFSTFLIVLTVELLFEGLLMLGFEHTSAGISGTTQDYFTDYKNNYFGYTILALLISACFQVSLIVLFSFTGRMRKFGLAAGLTLALVCLFGSISGIVIMAVEFCPNWSGYWGVSFLFGTLVEVFIVQFVIMSVRFLSIKCC
jgi:hypothetical protein